MHKLVISDDEGKTTVVPLVRDELTIGRKEGNAVRLTERNVSRRHARIRRDGDGFIVEDVDSYNGVFLNDERIQGQARLKPGDRLRIGDYRFALDADGAAPRPEEASVDLDFGGDEAPVAPPRLVMLTPPAAGAEYAVGDGMRLGRAEDMEIWVNHRSISREHVRFVERDGALVVEDLSSANGILVNGQPCASAELSSADVLGLGQVRFRFVARGEEYRYEPEVDAEEKGGPEGRGARVVAVVAGALLLVGVVTAFFVSVGGTSERERARLSEEQSSILARDDEDDVVEPMDEEPHVTGRDLAAADAAADECRGHLEGDRIDEALEAADRALSLAPDHDAAAGCRADASDVVQDRAAFAEGEAALEGGQAERAHLAFERIGERSALRERPEVARARRLFAEKKLREAKKFLRRDPQRAHDAAAEVLAASDMAPIHHAEAERLVNAAMRRGASGGD